MMDDPVAGPLLELFDPAQIKELSAEQIKEGLKSLFRHRMDEFKEEAERLDEMRNQMLEKTGGAFARNYIEHLFLHYTQLRDLIEAEPDNKAHRLEKPFEEMKTVMQDFFSNDELANCETMVTGEDLIKMLDVFYFFGESIEAERRKLKEVA